MSTERVLTSVEDPNSFDTDPDPGSKKKFFTNPDPGQNYKNPDTGKIGLSTLKILYVIFKKLILHVLCVSVNETELSLFNK